eukprot:TRINITY_DN9878_c0_g4_i1.p1 TRINITY_DN9878_c0_g4~~TRINITY_DN9878_c0_g4_i1.p1  ORF type:complete len:995 (+),score=280.51 TRINITY_DN9878_c0_g4_i1:55-3039(+)
MAVDGEAPGSAAVAFAGPSPRFARSQYSPLRASTAKPAPSDNSSEQRPGGVLLEPAVITIDIVDASSALHRESRRRTELLACCWCVVYFVLLIAVVLLQMATPATHSLHRAVSEQLFEAEFATDRKLRDVRSLADVWSWLDAVWAPSLFGQIDGSGAPFGSRNALAASPAIRHRRLRTEQCDSALPTAGQCYDADSFSSDTAVGAAQYPAVSWPGFMDAAAGSGEDFVAVFPPSAWAQHTQWPATVTGHLRSGTVSSLNDTLDGLRRLRDDGWLGDGTAFVTAHCAVYNADSDTLAVVQIVFATTAAGRVIPAATADDPYAGSHWGTRVVVRRATLYDWGRSEDIARLVLECIVLAMVAAEMVREVVAVVSAVRQSHAPVVHLLSAGVGGWTCFVVLHRAVLCSCLVVYAVMAANMPAPRDDPDGRRLATLDQSGTSDDLYSAWVPLAAASVALAVVRLVRYMRSLAAQFHLFVRTLEILLSRLLPFLVLFLSAVFAYATAGWYVFGDGTRDYATFAASLQTVLGHAIIGADVGGIVWDPLLGTLGPAFPLVFFWTFAMVCIFLLVNVFVALLVGAHEAAWHERSGQHRGEPPRGDSCWQSLTRNVLNHPSDMLRDLRRSRWTLPVSRSYPLSAAASAEVVSGSSLRVILTLTSADLERAALATGFVFVLPPHLAAAFGDNTQDSIEGRCLFTRCESGYEPRRYQATDWCVLGPHWWMDEPVLADWRENGEAGVMWTAEQHGSCTDPSASRASAEELVLRQQWYEMCSVADWDALEACRPYQDTVSLPFSMASRHSRVLRISTAPLGELLADRPEGWARQSLVFEFVNVVSSEWVSRTASTNAVTCVSLQSPPGPASLTGRSQSATSAEIPAAEDDGHRVLGVQPPCIASGRDGGAHKVVVAVGDVDMPPYVPAGMRERIRGDTLLQGLRPGSGFREFVEDFLIMQFGVADDPPEEASPLPPARMERGVRPPPLRRPREPTTPGSADAASAPCQ